MTETLEPRTKLLILESHPVQYHAPVYRELNRIRPGEIHVAYATDCSVRGHFDRGFSRQIAWDVPLLDGYPSTILHAERGEPLRGAFSLRGAPIPALLRRHRPRAVLFCQLAYEFEWVAFARCRLGGIPVWLRTETTDEAFERGALKDALRSVAYRAAYAQLSAAFPIGRLNRQHYLAHGLREARMRDAKYCVPDRLASASVDEKAARRGALRARLGIGQADRVVGFFGKMIPKKDPELVVRAWSLLERPLRDATRVLFVGQGELQPRLEALSRELGCPAIFAGFINQEEITDYYLATDVLVLPSRRCGETWGLVVNEALNAGCGAVLSEAVGCAAEFADLSRVRVIKPGDSAALATALGALVPMARNFEWARPAMEAYSVGAAASSIAAAMDALPA